MTDLAHATAITVPPAPVLADRRNVLAFWLGCAMVTAGVLLHLPMFIMARDLSYRLCGMAMDPGMIIGMGMIMLGTGIAGFGLLPRATLRATTGTPSRYDPSSTHEPADGPLSPAHWRLMAVLAAALVIDVMKPASLGFVLPGMRLEYGLDQQTVAWLPFVALAGTVLGSIGWGFLADIYGRRAAILLSSVMFVGTSICGTMPSFQGNLAMCGLMGAAAGGMLPVAYALLAETIPARHRGWSLVLVGGIGGIGGYLAASGFSALLQPLFGWRVMWLLNLPTGLILIFLNRFIPESLGFLAMVGRTREAAKLRALGTAIMPSRVPTGFGTPIRRPLFSAAAGVRLFALSNIAFAWGLLNFGLLLWLPATMATKGIGIALSSRLLMASTLLAFPTVAAAALLYWRWSAKRTLGAMIGITMLGLAGLAAIGGAGASALAVIAVAAILIIGINGILSVLLPYTVETFPIAFRGRAAGWISGCSKLGGLAAQLLGILDLIPDTGLAAWAIGGQLALALAVVGMIGADTKQYHAPDLFSAELLG